MTAAQLNDGRELCAAPAPERKLVANLTIGYIVGSLSKNSINRALANALVNLAPEDVELKEIPISELPFYNYDLDNDFPAAATEFKAAMESVDALIIVTPEYSRSIPGVLKNALDWAMRPYGQGVLAKPVAVIGASHSGIGTAAAQQHLRAILLHTNSIVMGQPEGYITAGPNVISASGEVLVESTAEFLTAWTAAFARFAEQHAAVKAA